VSGGEMGRPLRIEYPGAFYHVTSRGNEKKDVFKSKRDREKFLSYLESATDDEGGQGDTCSLLYLHAFPQKSENKKMGDEISRFHPPHPDTC
jgi:hypothetical protein